MLIMHRDTLKVGGSAVEYALDSSRSFCPGIDGSAFISGLGCDWKRVPDYLLDRNTAENFVVEMRLVRCGETYTSL